jgi:hypothetical protein
MKCKIGIMALLLGVVLGAAQAQTATAAPPKPTDPLQAEFAKLQQEYFTALNAYYKPFEEAKTEEEASKIKLDPAKNPAKSFLPKFQALAKKAQKNPAVGVQAEAMVFDMAMANNDRKAADSSLDVLFTKYVNEPGVVRALYGLQQYNNLYFMGKGGVPETTWILGKLKEFQAKTTNRENQASALMMQAEVFAPAFGPLVDAKKGEAILIELKNKYPDTSAGKRAEGRLYVIGNLNVGQVAPDFEVTDENGKTFKLSDYRGQVVVLDFWGFW